MAEKCGKKKLNVFNHKHDLQFIRNLIFSSNISYRLQNTFFSMSLWNNYWNCCIHFLSSQLKISWKWLVVIRRYPLISVAMYKCDLSICSVLQEQAPTTPNAPVVIPKAPFSKGQGFVSFLLGRNAGHSVLNLALVCLRCMGGWSWAG